MFSNHNYYCSHIHIQTHMFSFTCIKLVLRWTVENSNLFDVRFGAHNLRIQALDHDLNTSKPLQNNFCWSLDILDRY